MSCLSAKSCIGLGGYVSPVDGVSAFLRTWNGAAWDPVYGALPASADDSLSSIACTSARFCVAVIQRRPAARGLHRHLERDEVGRVLQDDVGP
jgi:hypothetical protein